MEINETQNTNSDNIISDNNYNSIDKEINSNNIEELSLLTDNENKEVKEVVINKVKETKKVVINKVKETKEVVINKVKETKKDFITEIENNVIIIEKDISNHNIENTNKTNLPNTVIENFEKSIQKQKKIHTLCFSGGGIKGFSFLGALQKLIEKKIIILSEIRKFVGTSVGSILAFLLTLEWDIDEIIEFVHNFNFTKLNGDINSITFFEDFGIQDGERLKLLFIKFLESKMNIKDITFKDLFEKTKKKLIIIGTNLTKGTEEAFDYRNTPDFSVITALRISVSVPIIFSPVKYNNEIYVDGGIKNNFPISYCSKKYTIGFYVKNSNNNKIDSIKTLITTVLGVTADTISEKNTKKYSKNIVQIRNTEFNITKFDIDLEFKKKLIHLGYISADDFINNF